MFIEEFSGRRGSFFSFLVLMGDVLVFNVVLVAFQSLIEGGFEVGNLSRVQLHLVTSLIYLMSASSGRVVLHHRSVHAYKIVTNVFHNCFLFALFILLAHYFSFQELCLSWHLFFFWVLLFVSISFYRLLVRKFVKHCRKSGRNMRHVVLVGSSHNTVQLYREITSDNATGFKVHGYFADEPSADYPEGAVYLGAPDQVVSWLEAHPFISQLYCSLPSARQDVILPIINYCENHLVHFYSLPNLYNYLHHRVFFNQLGTVPYLSLRRDPLSTSDNRFIKRVFDVVVSGLFLCTLFPIILLVVTIITKITMPGPVFFKQKRNGLNDEEFYCYKFRSMKVNKDADKVQATKNDPRKTKWGNIMRKTSIDELPQFINVLKGEMSVVGPRPHMVKHTEEYSQLIDKYMVRHFVKPGVTGWAQVTGFRGETKELKDMEGRIKADIWYIEHWNLWLDLFIMYKTVANAVHGEKNAY